MKVFSTDIEGVVIIEPRVFEDERGYFFESFSERDFAEQVCPVHFVQDNEVKSKYGVVRGLHFQRPPHSQAKLVRAAKGHILDIAVDIRHNSPTYGKHIAVELSEKNHRQLFIPRGFAHGYAVLSEEAVIEYKCDNYYAPQSEGGILWCDTDLDIDWQIAADKVILSEKDTRYPKLAESEIIFE